MTSTMGAVRGRSVRSRLTKGRYQNDEDIVRLDYRKDASDNIREVLVQLARADVSKTKKLGYYNAFVRLRYRFGLSLEQSLSKKEILVCLRHGLFHKAKEIRTSCLRALRYFCHDWDSVEAMLDLHIDYLIVRSLDICLDNDMERVHAMRLVRKILSICPNKFPPSLLSPMISIAKDGSKMRDKLVKTCLATICELALHNAKLVARYGGIGAILHNILECDQLPRVNESLMATILSLLNHPRTRYLIKADVDLENMLAPFTDFDYKFATDASDQSGEESEFKYDACKMAVATIMKSWPGLIRLCKPDAPGLQSLIGMLYLPNMETRKEIMDVLFDVFRLSVPLWTESFSQALLSIDPSEMNETWRLTEGFVVEEGKSLLPHLAQTRPNLVDNHFTVILSALISAGLLEALSEAVTTSNQYVSVRATILLGELLHLSMSILPDVTNHYHHCLPSLVERATNFRQPSAQQSLAALAVSCLAHLHAMKRRGPRPCSLFLTQLVDGMHCHPAKSSLSSSQQLFYHLDKDRERDLINQAIRDSQVLYTKDNHSWDWDIVSTLLKWPSDIIKRLEDQQIQRFIRRIVYLYKPSKKVFSAVELVADVRKVTVTGLTLIEFLATCESEEGQKNLRDLFTDIRDCLKEIVEQKFSRETAFAPSSLTQTCSQYYFLFIGKASSFPSGDTLMDEIQLYHILTSLMGPPALDVHVKLITSCLCYSQSSHCRKILQQALTSASDSCRLYVTSFMRVLLRTRIPSFSGWGVEALVKQLSDQSKAAAMEALSILSEACEDQKNLLALMKLKPVIGHLGHKGDLMFARFLSIESCFLEYLKSENPAESSRVRKELDKWNSHYNLKYVQIVEERLTEALTTYEKTYDGSYVRRSHRRVPRKDVYVPVHLYGQLVQHEKGAQLLAEEPCLTDIFDALRYLDLKTDVHVLKVKAALWALGHVGRSVWGIAVLQHNKIIPTMIKLAEDSGVFTIRGTAFYALGLIASTSKGAEILCEFGWESVRHPRLRTDFEEHRLTVEVPDDSDGTTNGSRLNPDLFRASGASKAYAFLAEDLASGDRLNFFGSCASCPPVLPSMTLSSDKGEVKCEHIQSEAPVRPRLPSVSECSVPDVIAVNCDAGIAQQPAGAAFPVGVVETSDFPLSSASADASANHVLCPEAETSKRRRSGHRHDLELLRDNAAVGERKSCFDATETAASSGISSYESGTHSPGITSDDPVPKTLVCSSLDTAKQTLLDLEPAVEASDNLRHFANLHPKPAVGQNRSSRTLPFSMKPSERRWLYLAAKESVDLRPFTSSQDFEGYAALRELKQPRTNNRDSYNQSLRPTSFANVHMSKTRSLDFRHSRTRLSLKHLMPKVNFRGKLMSSCVGLKPFRTISLEALDDAPSKASVSVGATAASVEGLPSIPQDRHSTHSSASVNSSQFMGRPEYCGICVPVDVSMIFQVNEGEDSRSQMLDSDAETEFTKSKGVRASKSSRQNSVCPDDSSLYVKHRTDSCLGCHRICQPDGATVDANEDELGEQTDVFCVGGLEVHDTRSSSLNRGQGSRKCSFTDAPGGGSVTSQTSAESLQVDKELLSENTAVGKTLIRKEVLRLVVNLGSSVGVKSTEQALLILKQKFPAAFQDLCLYSEVCCLLSSYSFRLGSRRFVQELFQDLNFDPCMEDPRNILAIPDDCIVRFSEQFETEHQLFQVLE